MDNDSSKSEQANEGQKNSEHNESNLGGKHDTSAPITGCETATELKDSGNRKEAAKSESPILKEQLSEKQNEEVNQLKAENERLKKQLSEQFEENKVLKYFKNEYDNLMEKFNPTTKKNIPIWWKGLFQQFEQNLTYTQKEEDIIRKYPKDVINLLYQLQIELNSGKSHWTDLFNDNKKEIRKLKGRITTLESELQVANSTIKTSREKEADYDNVQAKNDELESERTELLIEISSLKTGGVSTPQHEALYKDFKELKEQQFRELSSKIFKLRSKCMPNVKWNRKEEIAKIRSTIAKDILLEKIELNQSNINIEKMQTELVKDCGGKETIAQFSSEQAEINQSIKNLVEESLKLVNNISHAVPPGELSWCEKGTEFNPEEHEVLLGCAEQGKVSFTVYPGYVVYEGDTKNKRIFEKILVFTTLEDR